MKIKVIATILLLIALAMVGSVFASNHNNRNFRAHLSGQEEVPPVATQAQGQAIFQVNKEGTAISYRIIAANIDPVSAAHIHLAPFGVNGPVVVTLCGAPGPAPACHSGPGAILVEGTFTEANLRGPLLGATLEDLLAAMNAGNTYVNVHTADFPAGEIRGQIR